MYRLIGARTAAFAAIAALAFGAAPALAVQEDRSQSVFDALAPRTPAAASALGLQRVKAAAALPGVDVRWNAERGVPAVVMGESLPMAGVAPQGASGDGARAIRVLAALSGLYGIRDAGAELALSRVVADPSGARHVRLQQRHRGVPVSGSELIVHLDAAGRARSVNGRFTPDLDLSVVPALTPEDAERAALGDRAAAGAAAGGEMVRAPSLVVWTARGVPVLAYELVLSERVDGGVPSAWRYWIDARTGAVLRRINDIRRISPPTANGVHTAIQGSVLSGEGGGVASVWGWRENTGAYYLWNKTNLWYLYNVGDGGGASKPDAGTYAYRLTNDWGSSDRIEVSAAAAFQGIQTYWRNVHGRSSFNNAGKVAAVNVHYGVDYANAYYDPYAEDFTFGDGDGIMTGPLAVMDVAAHEFQHGVTDYSVLLTYAYESGALNESWSDVFGALIEFYAQPDGRSAYPGRVAGRSDWLMGEDCWLESTALRDMRNPRSTVTQSPGSQCPSRYKGSYWWTLPSDNGGVHINSGVQNFFFYLLCEGGSGDNDGIPYDMSGIGIANGGTLAYLTLTAYLPADAEYADARAAWLAAADQADADGLLTEKAKARVLAAWAACGLGSADRVTPAYGLSASGEPFVGPFTPAARTYTIINPSAVTETWQISVVEPWISVDTPTVVLAPGDSTNVTVLIDQPTALGLAEGIYSDTIAFDNTTTGDGSTTRSAVLRVGANYLMRSAPYAWIPPVDAGHRIVSTPGGVSAGQGIPFEFNLYGVAYTSLYVCGNGLVGFVNDGLGGGDNADIPWGDLPNAIVCPMWDDLNGGAGGTVYMGESLIDGVPAIVVSWVNVAPAADPSAAHTFQAIIRESSIPGDDNDIVFQYRDVSESRAAGSGVGASIGIEDDAGGSGRVYSYDGAQWLSDQQSILFTRNPTVDTTPPTASIRVIGQVGGDVVFELRFSEIVTGLDAGDFVLTGTMGASASVGGLTGGGARYRVAVSGMSGQYGSVGILLPGGSVLDMDGNPNADIGPAMYVLPVRSVTYANAFDAGPEGWTASADVSGPLFTGGWEWGVPTYTGGPASAASGSNCWGTHLAGVYSNDMDGRLESPDIIVGANPELSFSIWHDLESGADYGYVEVFDGSSWRDASPFGGYTGASGGWVQERISLPDYWFGSRRIKVRFRLVSGFANSAAGMYVDDFRVASAVSGSLWVVSYAPTNAAPGGAYPLDLTVYNSAERTMTGAMAGISTPSGGVSIGGTNTLSYGTLAPGDLLALTGAVQVVVASAADVAVPVADLFHSAWAAGGFAQQQVLPLVIDGIPPTVGSNRLTASSVAGVTDWMGQRLRGDGGIQSALFQLISAGSNAVVDPPAAGGGVSGDDQVLISLPAGAAFGRFGEGSMVPPNAGRFLKVFRHGLQPGVPLYVRAWDAASFDSSVAYGDSAPYVLQAGLNRTNDFGAWVVSRPWNYYRDTDGDSIPDGWCVQNRRDPRVPVAKLTNQWSSAGAAGSSGSGSLNLLYPGRVAVHGAFVYVSDTQNSRIQIWNRALTTRLGSFGSVGTGDGRFNQPNGLAVDAPRGRLFVADTYNNRIVVLGVDAATGALTYQTSLVGAVTFNRPYGVAVHATGTVYVANTMGHSIQVLSPDFSAALTITGGADPGGAFAKPHAVAVAPGGRVYVADTDNHRIRVYEPDGTWVANHGSAGSGAGQFSRPMDVRIGIGGRVYVADSSNHRIQVFTAAMAHIGTFAPPSGQMGSSLGQLRYPQGVCPASDDDTVYVADTWNHRVQRLKLMIDGDGDGMDDAWEDLNGLNSSDPTDGMSDADGDGVRNVGEYRTGSNPGMVDSDWDGLYDGGELGLVTSVAPGQVVDVGPEVPMILQWNVVSGGVYVVQSSLNLLDPAGWKPAATVTSWFNNVYTWPVDVQALADTNRFYRYIHLNP